MKQPSESIRKSFKRSLLVGTTGMLAQAARWVADRSQKTFLVARHAHGAGEILSSTAIVPLDLDYRDTSGFLGGLEQSGALEGTDLAILWFHDSGFDAAQALVDALADTSCLIVTVRGSQNLSDLAGSAAGAPDTAGGASRRVTVILGAKTEGGRRRWLTWEEISTGVIDAICAGEDRIVGDLDHPVTR